MKKKGILCLAFVFIIIICVTMFVLKNNKSNGDTKLKSDVVIKNGVLVEYNGTAEKYIIPSDVVEIGSDAFSSDYDRGSNLKYVEISSNVKKLDNSAFSFTTADIIVIDEGLEVLENNVFMDSYISEIAFPSSIKEIGTSIMETEEGLRDCKIHVVKGSKIAKYFEKNMPYGEASLVYDYEEFVNTTKNDIFNK